MTDGRMSVVLNAPNAVDLIFSGEGDPSRWFS